MKKNSFDILKLIEDLTESEKLCLYEFLLELRGEKKADGSADDVR